MMKRIALTGNIGSGKTTVTEIFKILGVPVFNADKAGHELLGKADVMDEVRSLFGDCVFKDNRIDRAALALQVFNDKDKLTALNYIIHPRVFDSFNGFCAAHKNASYILFESALIFENNYTPLFDEIILVYAPEDIRLKRLMQRDNTSEAAVKARMKNQLDDSQKLDKVSHVIVNDDKTLIVPQVIKMHELFNAG